MSDQQMNVSPAVQHFHKITLQFVRKQLEAGCRVDQLAAALLSIGNGLLFDMNVALIQAQAAQQPKIAVATVDEAEALKRLRNNGNGRQG